jgi:F0F1-type ATP synthase membrane subunit c/vacuolar-type H+-ATPase subunit K
MKTTAVQTAILLCVALLMQVDTVSATQSYTTVASTIETEGTLRDGDIVSYNPGQNIYHPSKEYADEMVYGVVVLDPVLHLSELEGTTASTTGTPVVRYGEVVVNVSTLGGEIHAGDLVTTSVIEGFGQRVAREDGSYVLGFALEDMQFNGESVQVGEQTIELGNVAVALRIGPYVTKQGAELIASTTLLGQGGIVEDDGEGGIDMFKVFRYSLAAIVAALAILVAARRFGDTFSQSVISVGRNPLARSQIRSMVVWNSFLIILISCVGFGISALIIFVP